MEYLFVRIADLFYLHLRFVLFTFCNLMWANLYPDIVYDSLGSISWCLFVLGGAFLALIDSHWRWTVADVAAYVKLVEGTPVF